MIHSKVVKQWFSPCRFLLLPLCNLSCSHRLPLYWDISEKNAISAWKQGNSCALTVSVIMNKSKWDLSSLFYQDILHVGRPGSQKSVSTSISHDSSQTLETRQEGSRVRIYLFFYYHERRHKNCVCWWGKCIFGVFVLAVSAERNIVLQVPPGLSGNSQI